MKGPGAEWYEESEFYQFGKYINPPLGWNHRKALSLLPPGAGKSILDFGCGSGGFLHEAKKKTFEIWGLDFDRQSIDFCKKYLSTDRLYAISLEDFLTRFPHNKMDVVCAFEVLEHVEDPAAMIQTMQGTLKSGGQILISVPYCGRIFDTMGSMDAPPNHLTRWTKKALRAVLEKNGFTDVQIVVQPFYFRELAAFLRAHLKLGLLRKMALSAGSNRDQVKLKNVSSMMKIKDLLSLLVSLPFEPLLRLLRLPGQSLVATGIKRG
jgi:SAM-dependent methyltransferase